MSIRAFRLMLLLVSSIALASVAGQDALAGRAKGARKARKVKTPKGLKWKRLKKSGKKLGHGGLNRLHASRSSGKAERPKLNDFKFALAKQGGIRSLSRSSNLKVTEVVDHRTGRGSGNFLVQTKKGKVALMTMTQVKGKNGKPKRGADGRPLWKLRRIKNGQQLQKDARRLAVRKVGGKAKNLKLVSRKVTDGGTIVMQFKRGSGKKARHAVIAIDPSGSAMDGLVSQSFADLSHIKAALGRGAKEVRYGYGGFLVRTRKGKIREVNLGPDGSIVDTGMTKTMQKNARALLANRAGKDGKISLKSQHLSTGGNAVVMRYQIKRGKGKKAKTEDVYLLAATGGEGQAEPVQITRAWYAAVKRGHHRTAERYVRREMAPGSRFLPGTGVEFSKSGKTIGFMAFDAKQRAFVKIYVNKAGKVTSVKPAKPRPLVASSRPAAEPAAVAAAAVAESTTEPELVPVMDIRRQRFGRVAEILNRVPGVTRVREGASRARDRLARFRNRGAAPEAAAVAP
jgi:hypothetical protein